MEDIKRAMPEVNTNWYQLSGAEVATKLNTDQESGLRDAEASERLKQFGQNSLEGAHEDSTWDLVVKQLESPLILILVLAGILTLFLHEYSSTVVIFITVLINVVIGVVQEGKAGEAFRKLAESQTKYATVFRDGIKRVVPAAELVPGDLVEIEAGNYVPADIRLTTSRGLMVNEAALTGEWKNEEKSVEKIDETVGVSERTSMAFMGTAVSYGEAYGLVVATGNKTQIGKIAENLGSQDEDTPLQKSISRLAHSLVIMVVVITLILAIFGYLRGQSFSELVLTAIALAVSAIPEGLPVAITVILVVGMKHILGRGGFVRSMLAAETLGSTTTILTDKTGTLTQGKMHVRKVITLLSLGGNSSDEERVLRAGVMASDAFVESSEGEQVVRGRPVEKALVEAGLEAILIQDKLLAREPRVDFLKFDSGRRYAASLHSSQTEGEFYLYASGAPETLLNNSEYILKDGKEIRLTKEIREQFRAVQEKEGEEGARLIAVAYKKAPKGAFPKEDEEIHKFSCDGLVFGGYIALDDAVREDVKESIRKAKGAGAKVIMLTGDHLGTALAVAREVGIAMPAERGFLGSEVEKMSDKELELALSRSHVFARMLPEQKLRIAKLLQKNGEVVAMTGDGINDAPALRNANIGVAVGSGTEVAKEASDLVLVDNSFSIIVYAIEEGRRLLDNIKKSVAFLLSTNFSEIILVGVALILGMPLPLLPKQILWENVISGGLLNIIFAFEPAERDVMERDPAQAGMRKIMTKEVRTFATVTSLISGLTTLVLFWYLTTNTSMPLEQIRSITFIMVSIDIMFLVFSFKNFHTPIWKLNLTSNRYIFIAVAMTLAGLALALFVPPLSKLLSVTLPASFPYYILLLIGIFDLVMVEFAKWAVFWRKTA